ncbi:MAG: YfiR family protein [Acidobacteria bacterium]|nr:YfiR family protein [Acidobacteriota bacterium]
MDLLSRGVSWAWRRGLLGSLCVLGMAVSAGRAQGSLEFEVKGAYLLRFGEYVEWPPKALPPPGAPFVIGILGEDPFGGLLDEVVQRRQVQGRPVEVRRIQRVDDIRGVHILYVGSIEEGRWNQILEEVRGKGILTVGEKGPRRGAAIVFVQVHSKIRFEVDAEAAHLGDVKLSSKLLSLATAIRRTAPPG